MPPPEALRSEAGVETFGRSFLRRRDGILEGRFVGPPYARGYARGRLAHRQIVDGERDLDFLLGKMVASPIRRWLLRRLLAVSLRRSDRFVSADHRAEIAGLADAETPDPLPNQWSPFARHFALHALHDFSQRWMDTVPLSGACTGFLAAGKATADGHVYLARNFDFEAGPRFDRDKIVAAVVPGKGYPYLSVTFAGLTGVVSGFNSRGLGIAINALPGGPTRSAGEFSTLLAADVLQYDASVEAAVARIENARVLVSDIYLLADAAGHLALVEKTPSAVAVLRSRRALSAANSAQTRKIRSIAGPPPTSGSSRARGERMAELVARRFGRIDPAEAAAILRDRRGVGGAELGPGNRSAINAFLSTHSVIFDLTARRAWVAAAPHSLGPYVAFDLDLLARAAPRDPRFAALGRAEISADPFLTSGAYARYRRARKENERARREIEAGRDRQAREAASVALSLAPAFAEAIACRGEAELRLGDFAAAVSDFDAALALHPGPPDFESEIRQLRRRAAGRQRASRLLKFPLFFEDLFDEPAPAPAGPAG
jgi:isopenicillin-N N-acyltransferase-like protein